MEVPGGETFPPHMKMILGAINSHADYSALARRAPRTYGPNRHCCYKNMSLWRTTINKRTCNHDGVGFENKYHAQLISLRVFLDSKAVNSEKGLQICTLVGVRSPLKGSNFRTEQKYSDTRTAVRSVNRATPEA